MFSFCFSSIFFNLVLIVQSTDLFDYKQTQLARLGFNHVFWSTINSIDLETINISSPCVDSLKSVNEALESGQQWSTKLLTSSGHFPINAINTGYSDFGDYDSCLSVHWSNEVGKHCTISLLPTLNESEWTVNPWTRNKIIDITQEAVFKIGLCIPSKCTKTDLSSILTKALEPYQWHTIKVDQCKVKSSFRQTLSKANLLQKLSIFAIVSTILVILYATYNDWTSRSSNWSNHFSLIKNYNQLIYPNLGPRSDFIAKFGITVHLYTLIMHTAGWFVTFRGSSVFGNLPIMYQENRDNKYSSGITPEYALEILFVYGGLTRSLELWRVTGQSTAIVSSFKHMIIKMLQIAIIQSSLFTVMLIIPLIFDGPLSSTFIDYPIKSCYKTIWFNLLFWQNNYRPGQEMCTPHTWSIAVEFQLLPLVIILIHLYKRKPKIAVTLNSLIVIGGLTYVGLNIWINNVPINPQMGSFKIRTIIRYAEDYYLPTSMHLWIYLMGPLWIYLIMNNHQAIKRLRKVSLLLVIVLLTIAPFIRIKLTDHYNGSSLNAVYSVIYRLLTIAFYSIIISRSSKQLRSFFANPMDRNVNNNLIKDQMNTSIDSANNQTNQRFLHFVSTLLRSTYYIHVCMIIAIYTHQRKPTQSIANVGVTAVECLIASLIGGFIFHFIVINPITSLISSFRPKTKKK